MALSRVWLEAARPVRGSIALIVLRWVLWTVAALPSVLLTTRALEEGPARASVFANAPHPFPVVDLLRFLSRVPGWVPVVALASAAIAWLGHQVLTALPLAQATILFVAAAVIGACATWCRVVLIADGRRYVRRLPGITARIVARWPFQVLALQVVITSLSMLLGAMVLFAWRQSGAGQTRLWVAVWLLVPLGQSFLWHWRYRACCVLWTAGGERWASIPDGPWRVLSRTWGRIRHVRHA